MIAVSATPELLGGEMVTNSGPLSCDVIRALYFFYFRLQARQTRTHTPDTVESSFLADLATSSVPPKPSTSRQHWNEGASCLVATVANGLTALL